ncbi:MAG: hypothetical protein HY016_07415 [Nitrosomonadales bacterium]|nr:hypothetical protein [Nitrosomonadales bacterium]
MLSVIFGKKSDHPLADVKSAQEVLDHLPKNDAYKSLLELTEWIESVAELTDLKLDQRFAVLRLLDEAAQPYARKLAREYFTPFEINKFQENRLWLALSNFSRHTALAYYVIFHRYCDSDKGSNALKAQLPLLTTRTVHTLMWQLKYICARYGQVDNTIWANLIRVYRHAEQHQYLNTPVTLYPGMTISTSVNCEIGHLLLWYDIGLNSLNPLQMHLTERLIAQHSSTINIHPEISEQSRLYFDLNRPAEPARINLGITVHPAMRFIGTPTMQARLEELMRVLNKNNVPDYLALGGNYDAEVVRKATQHLLNYLISPPTRRKARRETTVSLNILNGFDKLFAHSNPSIEPAKDEPIRWITEDISMSGFSSILPKGNDNIGISTLLGVQPEGAQHWGVAVVRRLLTVDDHQLRAGVEILANRVAGVLVSLVGGKRDVSFPALWLYPQHDETHPSQQLLLMQADRFMPTQSLKTEINGKNYLLIPIGLQGQGIDYDLAKFKLIEQDVEEDK